MIEVVVPLLTIYIFIVIGFLLKAFFKDELHDKTVTLISVYALQPFLTFWGLYDREIDGSLFLSPLYYLGIVFMMLIVSIFIAKKLFLDKKTRSIVTVAALIGNTGNLGLPVGLALFGEQSIPYITIINLANIFFVFTFGVYYYSRGEFSVKKSLLNIVKLPVLWIAIIALFSNKINLTLSEHFVNMLQMGAYAGIVIQLIIFGIYTKSIKIKSFDLKLNSTVIIVKFGLLPTLAYFILLSAPFEPYVKGIILMELIMPLAVMNVNLAALYNCKVNEVTSILLYSTIVFIPIIVVLNYILNILGWK